MGSAGGIEGTLGRIGIQMTSTLELDGVLAAITRGLVDDLDAALARIWLVGPGHPDLRLVASAGLSDRLDGSHARVAIGSLKIGEIAATRTPVWSDDLLHDPRISDKQWVREHGLQWFGGYPLAFRGELLGVLAMFAARVLSTGERERLEMFAAQASVAIQNARFFALLQQENVSLKEELVEARPSGIVGRSAALQRVLEELESVAPTSTTVLIEGETGTGKELFARALHERSPRRDRALVKVNCAAIAPSLIESELFGHEKGAFTGAESRRIGRFERAHGGTLFLDEIGELPQAAQVKLLRVLQEREIERVGGSEPIRVDVRIVAATNRELAAEVKADRFRADLFYRLNVFPIRIPPLRDRSEDVPLLVGAFLGEKHRIDDEALLYLQAYDWPGNVRELQNVLERASILARGRPIGVADLPPLTNATETSEHDPDDGADLPLRQRVESYERSLIEDALSRSEGNQSEAARRLRTSRATLQYKIKTYGL